MIQIIEQAIKKDKVGCSYQAIVNAKTGEIEKYETLMRLQDEEGNRISPQDFVSIAKKARYYPQLTQKVVQEALFTFINRTESVSINLSIDDLMDDNTYSFIIDALRNCGCSHRVVFELLETEEIELNDRVFEFTSIVKKLGGKIAIDDFGSGYSNYAYLMKLGVDILKIDASLIKEVDTNNASRLIVRSIIDIAHALGMETVAEHVHTQEVNETMIELGVDYLQGYYLHEPIADLP
ncbi:MAG TPA: EAL domain-containing protein [Sulfurimonas sp.]|nr:EAL domain-containing protein [Sulfurimonas sp.]